MMIINNTKFINFYNTKDIQLHFEVDVQFHILEYESISMKTIKQKACWNFIFNDVLEWKMFISR